MTESRTKNSIRNYGATMFAQLLSIILNFIGRTVFIYFLGIEYLGVNGLFSNILSLLSLAELGVGTAIIYMMYKPIADNDIYKIAAYNQLFKKIYNYIGLFILIVGLSLTPFIDALIKGKPDITENIYLIYALFVINSSISYFYTYKRSLLIAYQKEYINNTNIIQFALIKDIALISILFCFKNFYLYLLTQIIVTFVSNIFISQKVNKLFPEIVNANKQRIPSAEVKIIIKNTAAMVCHKIGSAAISGTGNIFISYFVGLATVGIYSNYILISQCAIQIVGRGITSLTASFGNLVASDTDGRVFQVFKKIYFINLILSITIGVLYFVLIQPFITVWIGSKYLLESSSILIIVVNNLFFNQIRVPAQIVINTYGLFWQIKWKSLIEAAINLGLSFLLIAHFKLGINGVLLAALISNISTNLWWEPYVAYKIGMRVNFGSYIRSFCIDTLLFFVIIAIVSILDSYMDNYARNIIVNMCLRFIVSISLICGFIWIGYRKTVEFKYILSLLHIRLG